MRDAISQPSLLEQRRKCFGHGRKYNKSNSAISPGIQCTRRLSMSEHHHHDHQVVPSDPTLRVKALESLLVEKGLVDPAALDALIDTYEHKVGPRNGARVVARAWTDPAFKERLLANGTAAIAELGYLGEQGADIRVVENTPKIHNVIV